MIHRFIGLFGESFCSPPFGAGEGSSGDGDYNVYRACTEYPLGNAKRLSDFDDGGTTSEGVHNPTISPDQTKVLFEVDNPSTALNEIWVVSADGGAATQLVADGTNRAMHPSWGPDSDTFVYHLTAGTATSGGSIKKDTVSSPGGAATLKTASGGFSPYRPQFNYDGSKVAYIWDKDSGTGGDMRVMDADGSNDASLDATIAGYRGQAPQFGWANGQNTLAYDDGAPDANSIYLINSDGTGKTQINANGDAAGSSARVSRMAWPEDDSYVVISANLGLVTGEFSVLRAELDGSDTTTINSQHGPSSNANNFWNEALVFNERIWFIEQAVTFGQIGTFLMDGTDYRLVLDVTTDTLISAFTNGDGWSGT